MRVMASIFICATFHVSVLGDEVKGLSHRIRASCKACPNALDAGLVDSLYPVLGLDSFHRYRNRLLFSVMQNVHNIFRDCFSEAILLLFGFAGPQLHNHMRHTSNLRPIAPFE